MTSNKKEETKKCPACDKDVSIKAKRCPYCRQDLRGWFSRHPILTFIGFLILLGNMANIAMQSSSSSDSTSNSNTLDVNQKIESKKGNYSSYSGKVFTYEILSQQTNNRYVATFQPFLPKDDRNLVGASMEIFKVTYGANAKIDPKPIVEARENRNVIRFKSDKGSYYVLPIKEDTGEIHTLMYWKE